MRVAPYYRRPSWQRFFAGMAIGAVISWCIFVYIFGEWQERYSLEIRTQKATITELTKEKEIWQEEFKKLNQENEELLTVQEIIVKIDNAAVDKYKLDLYSLYETEDKIKEDINMLMGKDIDTVAKSTELTKRIISNKTHTLNGKRYRVKITEMIIFTTITIKVELMLD
ncbi:sporulation protein [Bacillus sp. CRN 9]|nr:sporulation protein [Bacillus sp. CRN 9]